jgi:putative cell wall-binding protein
VTDALTALSPTKIVVVGGTASVSAGVMTQLMAFAPTVTRVSGADRYLTAVEISKSVFGPGVPAVYLAAGTNFPDAMGGAAAAGFTHGPILLVGPDFYETETRAEVIRLAPHALFILGGEASIDDGVVNVFSPLIVP